LCDTTGNIGVIDSSIANRDHQTQPVLACSSVRPGPYTFCIRSPKPA
jgi:hypothetical protein